MESAETLLQKLMGECCTPKSPSSAWGSGHRPEIFFGFLLFLESVQTLIQKLIAGCYTLESPSSARGSGHRLEFFFGLLLFWRVLKPSYIN
jgi:hypothetical protein